MQETAQSGAPHWEGNAPKWEWASLTWERLAQAHSPVIARLKRQLEAERAKTALAEQKAAELQDQLADLAQACAYPQRRPFTATSSRWITIGFRAGCAYCIVWCCAECNTIGPHD